MWEKFIEPDKPLMKTCRIRIAFWIPKATDTHSVYVIHIALQRQQWLLERASMLTFIRTLPVLLFHLMPLLLCTSTSLHFMLLPALENGFVFLS